MTAFVNQLPQDPEQNTRTRRFMQILSQIMNSLLTSGTIAQTGPSSYTMSTAQSVLMNQVFGK